MDGVGAAHGGRGSRAIVVDTGDDDFGAYGAAYGGASDDLIVARAFGGGGGASTGAGPGSPGRH